MFTCANCGDEFYDEEEFERHKDDCIETEEE